MDENKKYEPSLVIWELTLKCNLKCLHCGSSAGKKRNYELSLKESYKLCDDIAEMGFKGITLFGGEPFLRKDWVAISRKIKDLGISLSVVSNGFVNAKKIIPQLTKLEFKSVQVGLDGASPHTHDYIRGVKGSFKKAVDFLKLSKKAGLSSGFITTVSKMNFNELPTIRDFIIENEFDWQIQEAMPIGRFPKEMVLSEKEYYALGLFIASNRNKYLSKKISINGPHNFGFHSKFIPGFGSNIDWDGCWAGKMVLGIQSDGSIKGCLALSDNYIEGNIKDRSIIDIWNDPKSFAYNRNFKKDDLGVNCKGCRYGDTCKGGCSTRSNSFTGIFYNDPYCFYRIEKKSL